MREFRFSLFAAAATAFTVSACAVGPDFTKPDAPKADRYTANPLPTETASADTKGGEAQRLIAGRDIPAEWWSLFKSDKLDALVREAFKANPTVDAATAALRQQRELVRAQQAQFFPTASGSFQASRNMNSHVLSPSLANSQLLYNLYTAQVQVSYVPDVFGLNRRTVESLEAQEDAQHWQLEATYLTLASNVVVAAVNEASLRGQIAATEDVIKLESDALSMTEQAQSLGQMSKADVAGQRTALAQAQATLPPLRKQLDIQRDALSALLGRLPANEPDTKFELADLTLPQDVPLSLPSKLVEQRPDIRAAEAQLHSASADIGVAFGNALPQLTLSATTGDASTAISSLFSSGASFWSVGGQAAQTLFDAGASIHKIKAARRAYDQAAAQYRSTVIAAYQNVADALHALADDAEALKATTNAEQAATENLGFAKQQFSGGQISRLTLINAEQTYQQTRIALVQAEAARLSDTAALFQALGGSWRITAKDEQQTAAASSP